jgi:hypothetical protein
MNTSTHPVTREEVMALQDDELAGKEREAVAGHVAFCHQCNEFLKEMEQTSRELRSWRVGELSERVDRLVLSAAKEAKDKSNSRKGTPLRSGVTSGWTRRRWVLVLGTCAATVFFLGSRAGMYQMSVNHAQQSADRYARLSQQTGTTITGLEGRIPKFSMDSRLGGRGGAEAAEESEVAEKGQSGQPAMTAEEIRQGPMIAQTVEIMVVAKDVSGARGAVEAILAKHKGYAAYLTVNTEQTRPRSLQASLRIPARELLATLSELKSLGVVQTETQKGEEVTQQHADLVARLKNSRETEKRLQAILQERTGKIADVLAVEQEIARVRGDIEQMQAEQKSVEHRVEFATIDLKLAEEYKEQLGTGNISVGRRLRNAAVTGLRDVYENLLGAVIFIMGTGPTLLLWVVLLFLPARWIWKKRQLWIWGARKAAEKV